MNVPVEMTEQKCRELISGGIVGRVAVCTASGPRIVPVNYAVVDGAIIFRTAPDSILARRVPSALLAFEVDHLDYERHRGWSVVAVGQGETIDDPDILAAIRNEWEPRPWAGGDRPLHIRLPLTSLTGRRIGAHWTPAEELPVRRTVANGVTPR